MCLPMQSHMLITMEVTIAEAATRLKVSQDTIRRRIRSHQVTARQVHRQQGHIWLVEVDQDTPLPPPPTQENITEDSNNLLELLREQLQEKDRQISELHRLLAQTALNAATTRPWWAFWR